MFGNPYNIRVFAIFIVASFLSTLLNNETSRMTRFFVVGGATLFVEMNAQAPVSSGLAQRKQPERLFSQAVSPQVRVLKQICDLRAKRHTTATGSPLWLKQSRRWRLFTAVSVTEPQWDDRGVCRRVRREKREKHCYSFGIHALRVRELLLLMGILSLNLNPFHYIKFIERFQGVSDVARALQKYVRA